MTRIFQGLWPLVTTLVALGCAPTAPSFEAPEPRPLGRDLPGSSVIREDQVPEPTAFAEPAGGLTLRDALVAALTNSPELAAYSWEARAKEAEALQAGVRPNPQLGAEIENFVGGGDFRSFHAAETTLALSQLIELGGKRGKRLKVAEQEIGLAAWDYETARIDVLTETTKAFIDVLAAQEQLALTQDLVTVAEEVLASVSRRVKAGSSSPIQENRARVELETSRIDRDQSKRALTASRKKLAGFWGGTNPEFSEAMGNIENIPAPPPLDILWTRIEQNPALARWAVEIDHRRAVLDLENSLRSLDLSVGAGIRYFNEVDNAAFVLELGMPLPVFDRNQGATRAAEMRLSRAGEERRATAVRIQTLLAVSHEELLAAQDEVLALRDRALPEAETAFESAQEVYLRGSMRFIDVLDVQRMLFGLKSRYFAALVRYHQTVADLERLTGESIATAGENHGRQEP
jgi:cobalt-zinc-cadmium efflux system outer membrane protein